MLRLSVLFCLGLLALGEPAAIASEAEARPAFDLQPYAGRVVYVDFWASWCAPCRQSFPWMMKLQEQLAAEGLAVVTVNVDRDRKAADRFLAQLKCQLPVVYDPEGKIAAVYQLDAMPSSFVYGRDGKLRATHIGFHPDKVTEVEAELRALLAEELSDAKPQ